jgi:hypothetical protein
MDPITLIVTALAAGAGQGITDSASAAVKDAYARLKARVKVKLGGGPDAELLLDKHEQAPETWQASLMAKLAGSGAGSDRELIAAAQALLDLARKTAGAVKYAVDARGGQGVQIGDHNRQASIFAVPPHGTAPADD